MRSIVLSKSNPWKALWWSFFASLSSKNHRAIFWMMNQFWIVLIHVFNGGTWIGRRSVPEEGHRIQDRFCIKKWKWFQSDIWPNGWSGQYPTAWYIKKVIAPTTFGIVPIWHSARKTGSKRSSSGPDIGRAPNFTRSVVCSPGLNGNSYVTHVALFALHSAPCRPVGPADCYCAQYMRNKLRTCDNRSPPIVWSRADDSRYDRSEWRHDRLDRRSETKLKRR